MVHHRYGLLTYIFLLISIVLIGCGSQTASSITEGPESADSTQNMDGLLESYLYNDLVNLYGLVAQENTSELIKVNTLDYKTDWTTKDGIAEALMTDLDANGTNDLVVIRFETDKEETNLNCIVDIYTTHGSDVISYTGEMIEKELPVVKDTMAEESVTTVLSINLSEENQLVISWKQAEGEGIAPGQAVVYGGDMVFRFENEETVLEETNNWLS